MNQELSTIEKVKSLLLAYGIPSSFEIENEAAGFILYKLEQNVVSVKLENDDTLVIETDEDE